MSHDTYRTLVSVLRESGVDYRVLDHPAEGNTDLASRLRGHDLRQAAKCMVVHVRLKQVDDHAVLAVVPGDRRVDLKKVRRLFGGSDAALSEPSTAEQLTGCVTGAVIPFSFDGRLEVLVDPELLAQDEIFFNAARLDRSFAMGAGHLLAVGKPRVAPIAK
jgi:Ala-tRNA(Pro) deacylase